MDTPATRATSIDTPLTLATRATWLLPPRSAFQAGVLMPRETA
jgi:hypothetical protein